MTNVPEGFERGEDGVLRWAAVGFERRHYKDPGEAIKTWWAGKEKFGCNERCFANYRSSPCGSTAKHDPDANGNPTKCGRHSAEATAKRKAKSDAAFKARMAEMDREDKIFRLKHEALSIVRSIADGHNDPRGLCTDWVKAMQEVMK